MSDTASQVAESVAVIRSRASSIPRVALILGSGLGIIARQIEREAEFAFDELPQFAPATATGHRGRLIVGRLAGVPVVALQGRLHGYEGHSARQIAYPVRVLRELGASVLVVTNAAGGLNPQFRVGEIVALEDQIDLSFRNRKVGEIAFPRSSDKSPLYDVPLREMALRAARGNGLVCHQGVYVGMLGPTYETRAEYRLLRRLGGDVVGMSTVGEVVVAQEVGFRVLGLSVVSNVCSPDRLGETSGEEVVAAVAGSASRVGLLLERVLGEIALS
jgi:purine-nucleoside phosphorylase